MRIHSDLKRLVDKSGKSVRQVSRDIDYRLGTVQDMYNDLSKQFPRELLERLCTYFNCSVGDLLILRENEETTQS